MLTEQRQGVGEVLRWSAALLTAAAAAIHFAVIPEHFDEDWTFGVFFATAAWAQLLWALVVIRSGQRRLLLAGIAGNVAIALVWGASRTTGLAVGPDAGAREAVQFIDVLATVLEILAAAAIVTALSAGARLLPRRTAITIVAALALIVVPLTTAVFAGHQHTPMPHEKERTHEQPSQG